MKGIEFLLLGLGALAGAFLRYKIAESPILFGVLPINILIINVVGSFILGMFVVISMHFNLDPKYSVFIAIGFCGSFTTMSSFALQSVSLIDSKHFCTFWTEFNWKRRSLDSCCCDRKSDNVSNAQTLRKLISLSISLICLPFFLTTSII